MNTYKVTSAYISINLAISCICSVNAALLLACLNKAFRKSCRENSFMIINDEVYFPLTHNEIEYEIGLKRGALHGATAKLKEKGFIKTMIIGTPQKTYYSLNEDRIIRETRRVMNYA